MAKYICIDKTWLSHECRAVEPGDEFETTFPDEMRFGSNIKELKPKRTRSTASKPVDEGDSLGDEGTDSSLNDPDSSNDE